MDFFYPSTVSSKHRRHPKCFSLRIVSLHTWYDMTTLFQFLFLFLLHNYCIMLYYIMTCYEIEQPISIYVPFHSILFYSDELKWIELNWIELNWIELNCIVLNCIDYTKREQQLFTFYISFRLSSSPALWMWVAQVLQTHWGVASTPLSYTTN